MGPNDFFHVAVVDSDFGIQVPHHNWYVMHIAFVKCCLELMVELIFFLVCCFFGWCICFYDGDLFEVYAKSGTHHGVAYWYQAVYVSFLIIRATPCWCSSSLA